MPGSAKLAKSTLRYALINATTEGGANTIVAAVEGRKIIVVGYAVSVTKVGAYTFKDATASRAKLQLPENGGATYSGSVNAPAWEGAEGKALELETVATGKAYGHLCYVLI